MSAHEHDGPSENRIAPGNENHTGNSSSNSNWPNHQASEQHLNSNSKPKVEKINSASRNIKKRSPKQNKVTKAVTQAARFAKNPAHDFHRRKREVENQRANARKAASQFVPKSNLCRMRPPPRNQEHMIQYNKRHDPIIANQKVERRQEYQEQTINKLKQELRKITQLVCENSQNKSSSELVPNRNPAASHNNIPPTQPIVEEYIPTILATRDIPLPNSVPASIRITDHNNSRAPQTVQPNTASTAHGKTGREKVPDNSTEQTKRTPTVINYDEILEEVHPQAITRRKRTSSSSSSSSSHSSQSTSTDSSSSSSRSHSNHSR